METIFENQQSAIQESEISQIKVETRGKKSFDKAVIRLSNGTSPFVCNKTSTPGWGLAEKIGNLVIHGKPGQVW
jgi:hypothetical protein